MTNEHHSISRNKREGWYAGKRYGRKQRVKAYQKEGVVSFPREYRGYQPNYIYDDGPFYGVNEND